MLKVGTRVRYIRTDTEEDIAEGFYPPIGTLGTVKTVESELIEVAWDEGTSDDGVWWCEPADVEEVPESMYERIKRMSREEM